MIPKPVPAIIAEQETESRQEQAQKLFEEILKNKKILKVLKDEVKDLCAMEPGYEEAFEKQNQSKATLKDLQTTVENRDPEKIGKIKDLKDQIKQDEGILNEILMYSFIDLSKSGKPLDPRQMSLFDHHENTEFIPVMSFKFDKILKENEKQNDDSEFDNSEEL